MTCFRTINLEGPDPENILFEVMKIYFFKFTYKFLKKTKRLEVFQEIDVLD